jgi:membrane protease YdiL (CAAX protease family)
MVTVIHPHRLAPLYGLTIALLPVFAVLQEFWWDLHPLLAFAFIYAMCALLYYALREYFQELSTGGHEGGHGLPRAAHLVMVAIFALGFFGVLQLLFTFAVGHAGWNLPSIVPTEFPALRDVIWYGLALVLFLAVLWLAHRFPGIRFNFHLRWRFAWWDAAIIVAFVLLTVAGLAAYMYFNQDSHGAMQIFGTRSGETVPWVYWAGGIAFALANALFEELWFRGILLGSLRPLVSPTRAIILQAVVFGLIHWFGTPQGVLGVLLTGVWGGLLGWWVYKRGSLWPAVIVHFAADMIIFAYTN